MIGTLIARRALRTGFDSVIRRDLDTMAPLFSDDATLIYPAYGTIEGKTGILAFYRHFLDTFPKIHAVVRVAAVENLFDFVGTNTLTTMFEVDTTNHAGVTFHQEGMQLIRLRRGKIEYLRYFFADTVALANAWSISEREAAAATGGPRRTP